MCYTFGSYNSEGGQQVDASVADASRVQFGRDNRRVYNRHRRSIHPLKAIKIIYGLYYQYLIFMESN